MPGRIRVLGLAGNAQCLATAHSCGHPAEPPALASDPGRHHEPPAEDRGVVHLVHTPFAISPLSLWLGSTGEGEDRVRVMCLRQGRAFAPVLL